MISNVKVKVDQLAAVAPLSNGQMEYPVVDKMGNLFTANWQTRLAMAGKLFSLDLGTAGTLLAGNHDIDADQPEFVVAVDSGWLIPVSLNISVASECDADADQTHLLVVADRTQAEAAGATATVETALNLLDGGDSFGGRCYSVVTGNLTAVTEADILYSKIFASVLTTSGLVDTSVNAEYQWTHPRFLAGPCQILGYCVGVGAAQVSEFIGNFVFAHLPESWVTTS